MSDRIEPVEYFRELGWGDRAEAFHHMMCEVDHHVMRMTGLSLRDLPDFDYATAYEEGEDFETIARAVVSASLYG